MRQLKGLLFDKDGTLIDITRSWLQPMKDAAQLVARHTGQTELADKLLIDGGYLPESNRWAEDSIIAFETSEAMLSRWAKLTSPALINTLLPEINAIVHASIANAVPVINDIQALFRQLAEHYVLGVASMDGESNVAQTLNGLELHEHVAFYCGADSGFGHKPGTGMIDAFCKQARLQPDQIGVVGDSTHDLKMAKAAGSMAIAVLCGASSVHTLEPHADYIFADIKAFADHVLD